MIRRKRALVITKSPIRNHLRRRHSYTGHFSVAVNGETCYLDCGLDATLIPESLANKLQLSGTTKETALTNP